MFVKAAEPGLRADDVPGRGRDVTPEGAVLSRCANRISNRKDGDGMSVQMASAKIKAERVNDVRAAANKLFATLDAVQPEDVRYAWGQLADGETFVALVEQADGVENPIPGLPEFRELQEAVESSLAEPPTVHPLTVVGSYRLF
jgi:hypothetical protein